MKRQKARVRYAEAFTQGPAIILGATMQEQSASQRRTTAQHIRNGTVESISGKAMDEVMICAGYPPSANRYWRHANGRTYKSEEATMYQRTVRMEALASGVRRPMSGKIAIHIVLHPIAPKDYAKRLAKGTEDSVRCMDLDNTLKVVLDALNGVVIEDDSQVRQIVAERGEPTLLGGVTVRVRQMEG